MTIRPRLIPIQKILAANGFYKGAIDGDWGGLSAGALMDAIRADLPIPLTPHFNLEEFIESDTARALGNENMPAAIHLDNIVFTAQCFEGLRTGLGNRAIVFTSGYRNPIVNKAVGGVSNSAHALGFAGDIRVAGMDAYRTSCAVADLMKAGTIKVDQVIYEKSRRITHVSFDPRFRGHIRTQAGAAGTAVVNGIIP